VIWQTQEQSTDADPTAWAAADDVTDALSQRLMEDTLKQNL
jgi:hypothetical protein